MVSLGIDLNFTCNDYKEISGMLKKEMGEKEEEEVK